MNNNAWPKQNTVDLANLLYSLSITKTNEISHLFKKKQSWKIKGSHTKPSFKQAIFPYLSGYQIEGVNWVGYFFSSPENKSQIRLTVNPQFLYFDGAQKFYQRTNNVLSHPGSIDELEDEQICRENACMVYLHQRLTHDSVKKQTKAFYSVVKSRNDSIRKMVNFPSKQVIHHLRLDFCLSNGIDDLSKHFERMNHCRSAVLTHLRNHFKDQTGLKICKYLWRLNIDSSNSLSLTIHIMSNVEVAVFDEFQKTWQGKLQNYLEMEDWQDLKVNEPEQAMRDKVDLLSQLLEQPTFVTMGPEDQKKSVFGLGGLGGRKYKQ